MMRKNSEDNDQACTKARKDDDDFDVVRMEDDSQDE